MLKPEEMQKEIERLVLVVERVTDRLAASKKPFRAFFAYYAAQFMIDYFEDTTGAPFERLSTPKRPLKSVP